MIGRIFASCGFHADSLVRRLPAFDTLAEMQIRSRTCGQLEMRSNGCFGPQKARAQFVDGAIVGTRPEDGKAPDQLAYIQNFKRQMMLGGAGDCALYDRAARRSNHEAARKPEKGSAATAFEAFPEFIGALQKWNIGRILVIRLADDARLAMRRAAIVRRLVLIESQHSFAPRSNVIRRGAAHATQTEHDHIKILQAQIKSYRPRWFACGRNFRAAGSHPPAPVGFQRVCAM